MLLIHDVNPSQLGEAQWSVVHLADLVKDSENRTRYAPKTRSLLGDGNDCFKHTDVIIIIRRDR